MFHELRFAIRTLLKNPGFTATAVATLALGIGANTAIFSVVSSVMLKPLPYPDAGRLVMVWEDNMQRGFPQDTPAPGNFIAWRNQNRVFEDMAAMVRDSFNLTGMGEPERLEGLGVTASLFPVLGVKPALGREFLPADDQPGAANVVILHDSLWQRRFYRDPDIIGKSIALNGQSYRVVGVMPRSFHAPISDNELWIPLPFDAEQRENRHSHFLFVIARLKPGVRVEQAQSEMHTIARRMEQEFPATNKGVDAGVVPLREQLVGDVRTALVVLLAAVAFVLLIACANVTSLLLVRSAARQKEIALRAALGAGTARLARQLFGESLLLATAGGTAGLLLAVWSLDALLRFAPEDLVFFGKPSIDASVLGFTALVSIICAVIFGFAPMLASSKIDLHEVLKSGGRTAGTSGRGLMRRTLVAGQIALALILLIGSGLLLKSFSRLVGVGPGFRADHLLTMRVELPDAKYAKTEQRSTFYRDVIGRVDRLPGVQSAGFITWLPMAFPGGSSYFTAEGHPHSPGDEPLALTRQITPDYFRTMRIPLRQGRAFDAHDIESPPEVAIINEAMARHFWPGEDALGKRFKYGSESSPRPWKTIVGIMSDVRQFQLDQTPRPEAYLPYTQPLASFFAPRDLVVRTAGDPLGLARAVRQEIRSVDAELPISNVQTMEELVATTVKRPRFNMLLLSIFAGVALVLAAIGIYGLLAYSVAHRTNEIGIRMAVGAARVQVLRLVVGQAFGLIAAGLVVGLAGALALTRGMKSLLFGVTANDTATFVIVPVVLLIVALASAVVPARRATRVDPITALRYE